MCFTCRGGSRGVGCLTKLRYRVGPLKKDPHGRGGRVGEGVGGSICRVLRGSEALGGRPSNQPVRPGGSAKEGPHVRGGN